ncbi:MAG: hypothetical protein PUC30_07165 [Lachnospiraceae bacterium]|nr:hypothetical protein [Lachnospiraceae bacterium]
MDIIIERFSSELERYKIENGYSSVEKIIEVLGLQCEHYYNPEDFSRFKSGKRKFKDVDFERFSELFKVRKEYLSGLDNFRTEADKINAEVANRNLLAAFHKLFVALGYADCMMDNIDYNLTFPSNTRAFIESIKDSLDEQNATLLCDVNADNIICLSKNEYNIFLAELTDFIEFKLSRLFMSKEVLAVPTVVLEDNSTLLHPKESISLKDGTTLIVDMEYTPTSEFTDTTLANFISITEQ